MSYLEQAFVFQFRICFGHGVMTNDQLFGQCTDSRQLITLLQDATLDRMADLLHQLQIERLPSGRIEREYQVFNCTTVSVQ
jgi:hypothetical protein